MWCEDTNLVSEQTSILKTGVRGAKGSLSVGLRKRNTWCFREPEPTLYSSRFVALANSAIAMV